MLTPIWVKSDDDRLSTSSFSKKNKQNYLTKSPLPFSIPKQLPTFIYSFSKTFIFHLLLSPHTCSRLRVHVRTCYHIPHTTYHLRTTYVFSALYQRFLFTFYIYLVTLYIFFLRYSSTSFILFFYYLTQNYTRILSVLSVFPEARRSK